MAASAKSVANIRHAPPAPLPFKLTGNAKHGYLLDANRQHVDECPFESWGDEAKALRKTWQYLVHAGNAYPQLVDLLRRMCESADTSVSITAFNAEKAARAFLDKIGEPL